MCACCPYVHCWANELMCACCPYVHCWANPSYGSVFGFSYRETFPRTCATSSKMQRSTDRLRSSRQLALMIMRQSMIKSS